MASFGGAGREYVLKIIADVKDAVKGVDDVATKTSTMKDKMVGVGKAVAGGLAAAAVVDFGRDCVNAAADADDAMDAVESAFGSGSKAVTDFSKNTAEKMGLSSQDYQTMAAQTGRILTGFGVSNEDAAKQTNDLATRAADMAAIVGGSTEDAMGAIDKAMQGQTKGLKAYGISLDKAEIDARAMAAGYVDASGKVTDAGRAIATQQLILEKTSQYQGEFAKNSKDLGSQQDIMRAKMEDLQTSIGNALLPIMIQLFDVVRPFLDLVSQNVGWLAPLAGLILGVVAAVKLWNIAQLILNSTLLANPIFLVVAAITALVAGLIWAYNNVEWFREGVDAMATAVVDAFNWIKDIVVGVFNWISNNWPLLLAILTGPFGLAVYTIVHNWDSIRDWFYRLPGVIQGFLSNVWNILTYPFVTAASYVTGAWQPIKDFIYGIPGFINTAWSNLSNIIQYPFKAAFNAIKWLWNSTVGGFGFNVPDWIPGFLGGGRSFTIPKMASGGIVNRPTIAMIGEAGPEAVVPLDKGGIGTTYIVNVYALNANAETGRMISESLREFNRTNGSRAAI